MNSKFKRHSISRRKFIAYGTALGGAISVSPALSSDSTVRPYVSETLGYWFNKPLRILQTVLREPDARDYDARSVVDYMVKSGCNTLVVNGGGIVDFFRNPLPAANINSFMGERDILREITQVCHDAGIYVIARVDFRGVEEKIYRQYPEWFSVDQDLNPVRLTYTRPQLYASCYSGYYRNEHAIDFTGYLMKNYDLDGIWHNSVGVGGICYCSRCRESFKAFSGESIPEMPGSSDEKLDIYMKWKSMMADRHMDIMKKTVKSFGPDKAYSAEVFNMFQSGQRINDGIDLYNAREHFDFLISVAFLTENAEAIHYEDLKYAGTIIRFLKSMAPEKEAIILYGGNGTSHRYVMEPETDLKVWLWEALAAGGRFWNCNFTGMHPGVTYDRRNAYNHADAYLFVRENEKILANHSTAANVAIYYSKATRLSFRNKSVEDDNFGSFIRGMETILVDDHIPYDFIADDQVTGDRLSRYKLVILPNVRCLSERETDLLKSYVVNGGNILATYETGMYNSEGSSLGNFSLAEVFGCNYTGQKINTRKDCYQYIADGDHFIVRKESQNTNLLINAGYTLLCRPLSSGKKICTYVPMVHNQPPEKAWTDEWSGEFPTVLENIYGKGKCIYFSNQPDLISYEMGHPDVRNLLLTSIRYLADDAIQVETTAPESVHIGLTRSAVNPGDYIFSMVNTTSAPVRPLRKLLPVFGIDVKLDLGGRLKNYTIMKSEGKISVGEINGKILLHVEKLNDFFSVHLQTEC